MTSIVCTGDLILDEPDPDHWLAGIAPALQQADLAIGHLEVPHTHSGQEQKGDIPAPGADPSHLKSLFSAGFQALTLAGNHIGDCGEQGIFDTMAGLDELGIGHCGTGSNLEQARKALLMPVGNRQIALLSYNCVGPEFSWATAHRAGCAWLPLTTEDGSAVTPAGRLLSPTPEAQLFLEADIAAVRDKAGLVIVALHKGTVHTPAVIEPYEQVLAHMAIDAGADVVISHHAHIVRGIEFYRGKPVFHGLGNGCVVTRALSPDQNHPARAEWARRRRTLFGFEPDPAYYLAPFHPQAVSGFMASLSWHEDGELQAAVIPVHVDPPGRPRLASEAEAVHVMHYLQDITERAGLPPLCLTLEDGLVNVSEGAHQTASHDGMQG